ncbi:DUF4421 family protein [Lutimonas sp.]|uniref:DUF4421 family protein n=1 Tax=Lutimonas sp. TaxID=1872403 RepID=UPI003D9BAB31
MKQFFLVIFIFLPFFIRAQLEEDTSNSYFVKMNNTLNLRLDLDNDVRSFVYEGVKDNYSIEPNTNLRLAVAVNYRFISLKIGFSPKFLAASDAELKGNTKIFRLSLNIFLKDIYQNFDYNQVKGYYIESDVVPTLDIAQIQNDYVILPNLKTLSITGTTSYRFNENYSFKAVINQNEIQTKSSGSFIPSLYYGYFEITDDTTPQDIKSWFAILNAGYFHTFVINQNWYSNLGLSTGLGIEFNKLITRSDENLPDITTNHNNAAVNISTQIGLGYNSRRFYGGTALTGNATQRNEQSIIQFDSVRGYFKIYVGYRFDAPKSFEKGMDWIESKNPFKKK